MKPLNCLIVDDEPIAREILLTYCTHLPMLHVAGTCGNALEARRILQEQQIDILFQDVHLPVLDGMSFAHTLKNPPQIIFTTAYREYATNAFDLDACDYLVKPFSLERFIVAVDKAIARLNTSDRPPMQNGLPAADHIFIKSAGKIFRIEFDDLLYAEAQGNETRIVTRSGQVAAYMTFTNFEQLLPASTFIRTHRSFIINTTKISHLEGNRIFINKVEIPIGANFRESVLERLGL